jgi:hypothetical protein
MPFAPSAAACNQSSQTCSCRCVGFKTLIQRLLFPFLRPKLHFYNYQF